MMILAGVVLVQHEQIGVADSLEAVVKHRWILAAELSQISLTWVPILASSILGIFADSSQRPLPSSVDLGP